MKQVASLRYDVIFKKAFSQVDVFTAFANDMFNIDLKIDKVETEKVFDPPIGKVATKFDLYAQDLHNRIIVDVQHEHYDDHYDRFLHYHCSALLEQVNSSQNYRPGLKVFTVVVLTSADKQQTEVSITDFDPRDLNGKPLGKLPHKLIYLCPKYVTKKTPSPYREWLQAIWDSLDEQVDETRYTHPAIQKVFDTIEKDLVTPDERARMFEEYNQETKKREVFEEGKVEGRLETAQNLLSMGTLTVTQIAKVTGLTIKQVKSLST